MASIVTRAGKGSPLTNAEVDANFTNLNTELLGKQSTLVSGTSIKTVNGQSVLGSGNIQIDGGVTSFNTRTGAVTLSSGDVTTALGYTPYNSTNPNGYITSSALSSYLPLSGGALTGDLRLDGVGTGTRRIYISEFATDNYGAVVAYDSVGDQFYLGTRHGSTSDVKAIEISRGGTGINVPGALTQGGNQVLHAGNYTSYAPSIGGGSTIGGITYFSNGESMQVYGIRGRFSNEFIHLYNKVGIGNPNGWGVGESSTPDQGLSTYGGISVAYGTGASSTFNGAALFNRNNPAITNGSYTVGNNHIELRTTDASNPAIGFHRGGYTAVTLYHNANNSLRLRDANTGADSMMVHSSNYYDAGIFGWRGQVPTNGWNDATTGMWVSYNQTNETGGPGGYSYGGLLSFRASDYGNNHRAQMYFSHTGEFKYRTGWNDWSYGWYTVLNSSNYSSYALPLSGGTITGALTTNVGGTSIFIGAQNVSTSSALRINFHSDSDLNYYIGKRAGTWTQPLDIAFYTGVRYHAHNAYGGHRWYTTGVDSNLSFSVGDGDNNVRVTNTLYSYAYRGNSNVAGTGEASYHPAGIYSTGTNWLYGTMYLNGNTIEGCGRMNGPWTSGSRCYSNEWIEFGNYSGLYSPNNGAHFYPNNLSYGSWRIDGTRNGWAGIEFANTMTLMMNDNACGVHRNAGGGWRFYVEGASLFCNGNITAYWSDERLKENLRAIHRESIDILKGLTAYRFNWNSKVAEINAEIPVGKEEIGLIAQHVQRALPDAVNVNKAGAALGDKDFDYLTINYDRITPLLVEAVNIHEEDITGMKAKIAHLEALIAKLIGD